MSSKKLSLTKETLRQLNGEVDAVNAGVLPTLHNTCYCPVPTTTIIRFTLGGCPSIACTINTVGTDTSISIQNGTIAH